MDRRTTIKWVFLGFVICLVMLVIGSILLPGKLTEVVYGIGDNPLGDRLRTFTEPGAARSTTMVEMDVLGIRISQATSQSLLVLKERGGDSRLVLVIGLAEANAINVVLEGVNLPRPLTHDLLQSLLNTLGASVDYIVINDLKDDIYYAKIAFNVGSKQMEIDSRPSDAIALALRVKVPIYTEQTVLDKASSPRPPLEGQRSSPL